MTGKTGFVIGPGHGRRGRGNVVLGGNGLGRRSAMPGIDVALVDRGLIDGVGSVQGFPNFIGCRGSVAEVVEIGEVFAGSRVGGDERFVIEADAVDGIALRLGIFEAGGAREGIGGDLGGPDGGAGAGGVELIGEQAVGDLGHEELDRGCVFEEGDGEVVGIGERRKAVVVVSVAEMEASEGDAAAAVAVSTDGAALGFGRWLGWDGGFGGDGDGFGHFDPFVDRAQGTG